MKKRRVNWPFGNQNFADFEVESAAGLLVARRNHALVRTGERLCQGWDLWLDANFAGAISSRTVSDLSTLSREELLSATRAACCERNLELHPDQPRLLSRSKGGPSGRRPKGQTKRIKLSVTLAGATLESIDARRSDRSLCEYLDSLFQTDPSPYS